MVRVSHRAICLEGHMFGGPYLFSRDLLPFLATMHIVSVGSVHAKIALTASKFLAWSAMNGLSARPHPSSNTAFLPCTRPPDAPSCSARKTRSGHARRAYANRPWPLRLHVKRGANISSELWMCSRICLRSSSSNSTPASFSASIKVSRVMSSRCFIVPHVGTVGRECASHSSAV